MKKRVKMLKTAAGTEGVWPAGAVVEVEATLAAVLVRIGAAEEEAGEQGGEGAGEKEGPEAAVVEARERAVRPRARGRKGGL